MSPTPGIYTLSQRLAEGRIPVPEALRYCMALADSLRKFHEEGRVHGALCPAAIALAGSGVELITPAQTDAAIPYAAPEVLAGSPAQSRSDIFSFGAVVFEVLSGKRAFEDMDRRAVPQSGSPAVDRLVSGCLAYDASARVQRLQKVMLELKLLSVAASRAAVAPIQVRTEMQQMEARLVARLEQNEKTVSDLQAALTDALNREAEARERISRLEQMEPAASIVAAAVLPLQETVEGLRKQVSELYDLVAKDFQGLEKALQAQAGILESARTAMAQTDDLVERVVEALESLQSSIFENAGERTLGIN